MTIRNTYWRLIGLMADPDTDVMAWRTITPAQEEERS